MSDAPDKIVVDLTRSMAAGRGSAIEEFYVRYFDFLLAWARQSTRRDEAFCLDVVQEAVLRVMRTIRPVESERQLIGWLRLVVRTTALDLLKAEDRRGRREAMAVAGREQDSRAGDAEGEAEQIGRLAAQIAALDPRLAELVEMRYRHGWTLARIAAAVGLSIGTIDGRLRRAVATLRNQLVEADDDG